VEVISDLAKSNGVLRFLEADSEVKMSRRLVGSECAWNGWPSCGREGTKQELSELKLGCDADSHPF
jgi:hypothetical protein